jgi:hypothetical protein
MGVDGSRVEHGWPFDRQGRTLAAADVVLVLKGGGLHERVPVVGTSIHTHQFDIHGTGRSGKGGQASVKTTYEHNAFQYLADNAISIRGRPHVQVDVRDNIFAHEGLENDRGDDAIRVHDRSDLSATSTTTAAATC